MTTAKTHAEREERRAGFVHCHECKMHSFGVNKFKCGLDGRALPFGAKLMYMGCTNGERVEK